jgi:hypothetical protein
VLSYLALLPADSAVRLAHSCLALALSIAGQPASRCPLRERLAWLRCPARLQVLQARWSARSAAMLNYLARS